RPPYAGRPGYPGTHPPGWRPPGHRPPGWRPPHHRPPHHRPPHYHHGRYYWYPSWGWYFTATLAASTLVYVATKPTDGCEEVIDNGEKLILCDGVIYRPTYYQDEQVYEIVSPAAEEAMAEADSMLGLALTSPFTRGPAVRELQNLLTSYGYDTGSVDGTFGKNTESALMWLQYDYGLEQTGKVDDDTARAMGILPPLEPAETGEESISSETAPTAAEGETSQDGASAAPEAAVEVETSPEADAPDSEVETEPTEPQEAEAATPATDAPGEEETPPSD
ncbi:peptidoglycan-binding protein, partial [Pseudophaeobacter sp.]|uniref:peptidoglycan-binding domain-containing protein n=1 Tax=Pseudophaeobacter sp. TaxID=1971739 RepID=UPI0032970B35